MAKGKILMYCNKLQKEFKKYEFFKVLTKDEYLKRKKNDSGIKYLIDDNNQYDLSYLIVIDDYYLISVFKDMSMDLFWDEQDELLKSKNILDVISKIKLHKLLTPLNISMNN